MLRRSLGFACMPACSVNQHALEIANKVCRHLHREELLADPELRDFMSWSEGEENEAATQSTWNEVYEVCGNGTLELTQVTCRGMRRDGSSTKCNITIIARRHRSSSAIVHALCYSVSINRAILWRCGVDDRHVSLLSSAISSGTCRIKALHVPRNSITSVGAKVLAQGLRNQCMLHTLDLSDNVCGDAGCQFISAAICSCPTLRVLNLRSNSIGVPGATALASALSQSRRGCKVSRLEKLLLTFNLIADKGAIALATALMYNSFLTYLDVARNDITAMGSRSFAAALRRNSTLQTLIVRASASASHNDSVKDLFDFKNECPPAYTRLGVEQEVGFMMALHPRLGAASPARGLLDAVARYILDALCGQPCPRRFEF